MIIFGVDVPLVEIILVMGIIIFILLVEAIIIIALFMKQLTKMQKLSELVRSMSETLLELKNRETRKR